MNLKITDVRSQKGDASFLIDDGKTSVLYDTGFGFTGEDIVKNVKAVLGNRALDFIFLTHSHYDHALGSANVLRHYPNAKVVAGKYAASIFERDGAKRTMKQLDENFAKKCGVTNYEFLGDELRVDIAVDEGDVISAGDMVFKVINLPGHTRCCVGFYCEKQGLLLANETLGVYDGEKTIMPLFLVSYADTLNSIEKVKNLKVKNVVAPHFGLLNETQTKFYLNSIKNATTEMAQEMLNSIKKGHTDEEIIEEFKSKFWHGYMKEIYPIDAITLNTSIMIKLLRNELA